MSAKSMRQERSARRDALRKADDPRHLSTATSAASRPMRVSKSKAPVKPRAVKSQLPATSVVDIGQQKSDVVDQSATLRDELDLTVSKAPLPSPIASAPASPIPSDMDESATPATPPPSAGMITPISPSSPVTGAKGAFSPPSRELPDLPSMTDEELDAYLRDFETISTSPDVASEPNEPLTPELEASEFKVDAKPLSPLLLAGDPESGRLQPAAAQSPLPEVDTVSSCDAENALVPEPAAPELKLDDFIDYNGSDFGSQDAAIIDTERAARRVPLFGYRDRNAQELQGSSMTPTKRALLAAWHTMAYDTLPSTREVYMDTVFLAAMSINARSMISGGARQTMAPELGA